MRLIGLPRLVATAVLIFLWTGAAAADDVARRRFVDLSGPGALEALQQSNPTHFEKIRQIMSGGAAQHECMLAKFNARDVMYGPDMMTYPTKRHLWFTLDGTRYEGFVTSSRVTPRNSFSIGILPGPFRAEVERVDGRLLPTGSRAFAVYHCGARIRHTHRPLDLQKLDWMRLRPYLGNAD